MINSPFVTRPTKVSRVMLKVLLALLPGIAAYVWAFGIGILVQIALATVTALLCEAGVLKLRRLPVKPFLFDLSAVLTAWLLALSLPPLAPWWLVVVGTAFAILIAKHMYGGLGNNIFNPAMVGFAVLIIAFAGPASQWPAPLAVGQQHLSSSEQVTRILQGTLPAGQTWDAMATATPLDTLSEQVHMHKSLTGLFQRPIFGAVGGVGSEWIAGGYVLGGLYLLLLARLIPWQIPVAYILGVLATAGACFLGGAEGAVSPWFHLAAGGTMLGAFFIATDPVTGPTTPRGRLIFGFLAGLLTYVIRVYGAYHDGVAFAVLIMNMMAPFIDRYTQPPVFGHKKSKA